IGEYSGFGRGGRFGAAARRKPSPIPRNEPRSTKFEKYARWTMFGPSHRMGDSLINSISALPRSRRTRGGMRAQHAREDLPAAKYVVQRSVVRSAGRRREIHDQVGRQMRPVSWAHMATSTRFRAPSFRMRLARWALTVLGVM